MFNCSVCDKSIGPRVKPVRVVTGTRPTNYHNEYYVEDEWGNRELCKVDSNGMEITGEALLCPEDGEKFGLVAPHQKKIVEPIRKNEEPLVPQFKQPIIMCMLVNALDRTLHNSKRAVADCEVAIPMVKQFVDNNPKFKVNLQ